MLLMLKENHQQNQFNNTNMLKKENVLDGGFLKDAEPLMKE